MLLLWAASAPAPAFGKRDDPNKTQIINLTCKCISTAPWIVSYYATVTQRRRVSRPLSVRWLTTAHIQRGTLPHVTAK